MLQIHAIKMLKVLTELQLFPDLILFKLFFENDIFLRTWKDGGKITNNRNLPSSAYHCAWFIQRPVSNWTNRNNSGIIVILSVSNFLYLEYRRAVSGFINWCGKMYFTFYRLSNSTRSRKHFNSDLSWVLGLLGCHQHLSKADRETLTKATDLEIHSPCFWSSQSCDDQTFSMRRK